jgi:hypothetical protein
MKDAVMEANRGSRHTGRSIAAVLVGIVVGIFITLATDIALHAAGVFPPLGQPTSDRLLLVATAYRSVYSVLSCYIIARLAPDRPMQHALIGGVVSFVVSLIGAVATWNRGLGPHWYPVALVLLSIPLAWVGGKIRVMQLRR